MKNSNLLIIFEAVLYFYYYYFFKNISYSNNHIEILKEGLVYYEPMKFVLALNEKGERIQLNIYEPSDDDWLINSIIKYTWSDGNIISRVHYFGYWEEELHDIDSIIYTYDGKLSPFKDISNKYIKNLFLLSQNIGPL